MRLFELFGKERIAPAWEYQAHRWLWHVRPTDVGVIVGVERDPEKKETAFFCVAADTGQELWRHASPGDAWWTGLEAVHRDMAFLHGYANPEMPQHRGITALDVFTGRKLWERPELRFAGAGGESVLAAEGDPAGERYALLSRATGRTERPLAEEEARAFADESSQLQDPPRFAVPLEAAVAEDPALEIPVRACLLGVPVAGPVGVLAHGRRLVLSYHEQADGGQAPVYTNVLRVVDRDRGKDLFAAALDSGIPSLVPESFFVQRTMLYCIRDRRVLTALPLGATDDTTATSS